MPSIYPPCPGPVCGRNIGTPFTPAGFAAPHGAHVVDARVRQRLTLLLVLLATALVSVGCAIKPKVAPSQGHINAAQVPVKAPEEKIQRPVTASNFVPPPRPKVRQPTYSVVVNDVPVRELLFALSRDTKQNIDVHPAVRGLVTLNAIDETLPAILDRVAQQVSLRYKKDGEVIIVMPDTPFPKTYRVNYVNISRESSSEVTVAGELGTGGGGAGTTGGGPGGVGGAGGKSSTTVKSNSHNNFWEVLEKNVLSILKATQQLEQSQEDRMQRAEAAKAAIEEKRSQVQAAAGAGANAATLFNTAFSGDKSVGASDVVVNPVTGTVTVLATEKQHALVQQYLDSVTHASQRQVLIEATIVEVQLSNTYSAGVDWSRIRAPGGTGFDLRQNLLGSNLGAPPNVVVGYANPGSTLGNIAATLKMLEQFGNTRVLSSPKLMAMNNQTALLKVVDNVVYFTLDSETTQNANTTLTTIKTTVNSVSVGLVMSLTPQINENGMVTLTVRPTISRVARFRDDPNPLLRFSSNGTPLAQPIQNQVPEISIREMESVLQLSSGQIALLGGLMQDTVTRNRDQVPGVGRIPVVGEAFQFRDESVTKSELVIFLKPVVVNNPSLASDDLKFFQRFLPAIDPTGNNP
jgi:MSHA type pilus biogenesis protein MshL